MRYIHGVNPQMNVCQSKKNCELATANKDFRLLNL